MIDQLASYRQLLGIEWEEERSRLIGMLVGALVGLIFFVGLIFALSCVVLILAWDTQYRLTAALALAGFFAIGVAFAWHRLKTLMRQGQQSFLVTRTELSTGINQLRDELPRTRSRIITCLIIELAPVLLGHYLARRKKSKRRKRSDDVEVT